MILQGSYDSQTKVIDLQVSITVARLQCFSTDFSMFLSTFFLTFTGAEIRPVIPVTEFASIISFSPS
jgi:hypothetical protein